MYEIIALVLLVCGSFFKNPQLLIAAGVFFVASELSSLNDGGDDDARDVH
jgi:hypothetical protein